MATFEEEYLDPTAESPAPEIVPPVAIITIFLRFFAFALPENVSNTKAVRIFINCIFLKNGAIDWNRTGDLFITNEVLYP